ncbi:hypothetical protein, partial [Pantoea sp. CTOTU49201]|uniref:hypothetical protein n=1 Tax=Pantoea sp. CTOTU49201 TaxID=2953855 RepID=UPI00289DEA18
SVSRPFSASSVASVVRIVLPVSCRNHNGSHNSAGDNNYQFNLSNKIQKKVRIIAHFPGLLDRH